MWSSFIFPYFIFFPILISLCFSSSGRYLYPSSPCSCFLCFLLQKDLDTFQKPIFEVFRCFFYIWLTNLWIFLYTTKIFTQNNKVKKWFKVYLIITINFFCSLHNSQDHDFMYHLKITWKLLKNWANYFKDNIFEIFFSRNYKFFFVIYLRMNRFIHQNYKNKNIEEKQNSKVKNKLLRISLKK